ncbi:MAG: YggS family pyridoxal phosphate-dependent enzyme [Clostridiales bacterium]|nr:YggS family pyridoxal phosphate-dependent enzyme [Clostridiales bacterium]
MKGYDCMTEDLGLDPKFGNIEENIKVIRERIAAAALKSGRDENQVRFMAVTKTVEPKYINHAIKQGIDLIGENKVQEYLMKKDNLELEGVEKHLIGHLQSNKVRKIITEVDMIESVDSLSVAEEIERQAEKNNMTANVLLEINVGGESSKTGMDKSEFKENLYAVAEMKHIAVKGLMTIPPICENNLELAKFFDEMYKLFIDIDGENIDNVSMDILSMGMSHDYEQAIICGSNLVRVGSAIFGPRIYNK